MKEDNIYTSEDGTRYVNYGRAFGDTEEVSEEAETTAETATPPDTAAVTETTASIRRSWRS